MVEAIALWPSLVLLGCSDGAAPSHNRSQVIDGRDASRAPSGADAGYPGGPDGALVAPASDGSICPGGILRGDFLIRTPLDLDAIAGCTAITGNLTLERDMQQAAIPMLELPVLASVGGDLKLLGSDGLGRIGLRALTSVGGQLAITGHTVLTRIELPALESVRRLQVGENAPLSELSLPSLVSTSGEIYWHQALVRIDLPALASIPADLAVHDNAALESIEMSALTAVDYNLEIHDNAALTHFEAPSLVSVGRGGAHGYGLLVHHDAALQTLALPALATVGDLEIHDDGALASVQLPALTTVDTLNLSDDGALREVGMANLAISGTINLDNDDGLETLDLPALRTVTASLLDISGNDALDTVHLAALNEVHSTFRFVENRALTGIDASALTSVGRLEVTDNPHLPTCSVYALRDQLLAAGFAGVSAIARNQGTCP